MHVPTPVENNDTEKHADTIRKLIEHENQVLNHRFTWSMASQGLLFAALGSTWDKAGAIYVGLLISVIGMFVAVSAIATVRLSEKAYTRLNDWWRKNLPQYSGPPRNGFDIGDDPQRWSPLLPHKMLPWVFLVAWFIVAGLRVYVPGLECLKN